MGKFMKKVIIWGMGNYYQYAKSWLNDVEILAFVNDEEDCQIKCFEEKPVIRSTEITSYDFDELIIAITNIKRIWPNLKKLDVDKRKIRKLIYKEQINDLDDDRKKLELFFCNIPNFGDALNSYMLDNLFQVDVDEKLVETAEMTAIGSILDVLLDSRARDNMVEISPKPIKIWGTGFKVAPEDDVKLIRPVEVSAVRGVLTKNILERMLDKKIDCVLADPGLLVSKLYKSEEKKYDVGIIPHHTQKNEPCMTGALNQYPNSVLIDVTDNPSDVIRKISECKLILSTSLHGLIVADSFGIPNQWCVCSDKLVGGRFKFDDYYSSFGLCMEPIDITKVYPDVKILIENYRVDMDIVKQKQEELLKSFPY